METILFIAIKTTNGKKKIKTFNSELSFRLDAVGLIKKLNEGEELIIIDNTYNLQYLFRKINGKIEILQTKSKVIKKRSAIDKKEFTEKLVNYLDSCQSLSCTIEEMAELSEEKNK